MREGIKIIRGMIAVALMLALVACLGSADNGASGQTFSPPSTTPTPTPITSSLLYNLQVGCANYFSASNSSGWFTSYGGQSKGPKVAITERDGTVISELRSAGSSFASASFPSSYNASEIERYQDKYLTFKCVYQQYGASQIFEYRHPISDTSIWQRSATNSFVTTTYFEVSMISDIQMRIWQALIDRGHSETSAWSESHRAITDAFGDVEYGPLQKTALVAGGGSEFDAEQRRLSAENQSNGRVFRKLKLLAEQNTSEPTGNIQSLIEAVVPDWVAYTLDCRPLVYPNITGAVFRQMTTPLSLDSTNFRASSWRLLKSNDPAFTSTPRVNIDGSWQASLDWLSGTSNAEYSVQLFQSADVPVARDYAKIFIDFSLIRALGGCQPGFFVCTTSSGIAGVFVCYLSDAGANLGCTVFTAVSDLITVPTHLGDVFTVTNPFGNRQFDVVALTPSSPNSDAFGLDRTYALSNLFAVSAIPNIQTVALNKGIARVEFGAVVLASSNSCYKCRAEIVIRRLGVLGL